MDHENIAWDAGKWTTAPVSSREEGSTLVVEAAEGSDYWEKTMYGFQHSNGHSLLAPWDDDYAIEVTFQLTSFTELYDQAGLMLWHGPTQWIKAGIELNDGIPHLAVVATDEYSDWSLSAVPEWSGENITIRASRMNDAVIIRARTDTSGWRTIRVARFPYAEGKQAGPLVCSPKRAGFQVTFTRWTKSAPDSDIHVDPPIDS
ncbi:DUF1349 domain-containing protein [Cohnella abietis]|uniref:DUF1349 domain-containing protein n=1 Tax=Cohnella abietis TaxID=2507935 RepID=A0A3T1D7M0_9BACL|nr:DUF1349 domain-containing protein [Cohnella abietis]BBI34087.1 hypothetical protein KCTCHS21_34860 [Cohnella abietis]